MQEEQGLADNIDLLLAKLKAEGLAAALTAAWRTPGEVTPEQAMSDILQARIAQVREAQDEPAD